MKTKKVGLLVLTAVLALVLAGCSGLVGGGADKGKALVGTYELESMELKSGSQTQSISKEQYKQLSEQGNIHITLELSEDGSAVLTGITATGDTQKADLKWKSDDGKTITFTSDSESGKVSATVGDNGEITLEESQDDASVKMVFSKISDKPGYYSDSSK